MRYFYEDEQPNIPIKPVVPKKPRQEVYIKTGSNLALDQEIQKRALKGRTVTGRPLPTPKIK